MLHLVPASESSSTARAGGTPAEIEAARLSAVQRYEILDTSPETSFDRITELAADLFNVPIAILGFIGSDDVSFKSHHGIDTSRARRGSDPAMSALASWIRSEFKIAFHAGVPLHSPDGHEIGMLCVIDRRSRRLEEQQMHRLRQLGGIVTDMLAMRLDERRALALAEITSSEVDHRAMNSLQFVASLLQLQSRTVALPETAQQLQAAADRVLAVARVHRTFSIDETADRVPILEHLRKLCAELSSSVDSEIKVMGVGTAAVPKLQVLPIGLIVNELATNARKHGGEPVTVAFGARPGADGGMQHELSVFDEGAGLPAGFDASQTAGMGLGMKVVNALVAQLQGQLSTRANPAGRGTCFTVTFPAT